MKLMARAVTSAFVLFGLATLAGSPVFATSVPITNPSFEAPMNPNGATWQQDTFSLGPYTVGFPASGLGPVANDWYIDGTIANPNPANTPNGTLAGLYKPNSGIFNDAMMDGSQVMFLDRGAVFQILQTTLQPNLLYTLTFYQGFRTDKDQVPDWTAIFGTTTGTEPSTATRIPLATMNVTGGFLSPGGNGSFLKYTLSFDSNSINALSALGQNIYIQFTNRGGQGGLAQLDIDSVALDASPLPEPASVALIGGSLVAFAFARRRRAA